MMEGTKKIYYVAVEDNPVEIAGIYSTIEKAKKAIKEYAEGAPIEWFGSIYANEDSGVVRFAPHSVAHFKISCFCLDGSLWLH